MKVSSAMLALTLGLAACSSGQNATDKAKDKNDTKTADQSGEVVKIVYARGQDSTKATEKNY